MLVQMLLASRVLKRLTETVFDDLGGIAVHFAIRSF